MFYLTLPCPTPRKNNISILLFRKKGCPSAHPIPSLRLCMKVLTKHHLCQYNYPLLVFLHITWNKDTMFMWSVTKCLLFSISCVSSYIRVAFMNEWSVCCMTIWHLLEIAHLSRPWSNGWVALSFLFVRSVVCPAMVTSDQISTFFDIYRHKSLVLTQFY